MKNEYIDSNKKIGVLISNLGTPDSPSRKDLKKYLNQFLMDKRVIDLPRLLWIPILKIIILNITDRNKEKCLKFNQLINSKGYRSKVDVRNEKIGYKIREATIGRIPLIAVIGDKEEEIDSVSVRSLDGKNLGIFNLNNLYKLMDELIEKKGRIE